jgi:diguanylate cyclase (GGDEF)-like protein
VCKNCIAIRAFNENQTFMKLENIGGRVYIVIASPLVLENGKVFVAELLKDITSSNLRLADKALELHGIGSLISQLNEAVVRDPLTGVYNRRYINEKLPLDLRDCFHRAKPIALIMADIDYFKKVNDTFGHLAGDHILREFSALISNTIRRTSDWCARYGGEEFLIVLKETDEAGAIEVAEKIRGLLEQSEFSYEEEIIKVTASFGVSSAENKEIETLELIEIADKALYEAKQKGRNKTVARHT